MVKTTKLEMKDYITSREKKQIYVNQMFATIAPKYDHVTAWLSYGQDRRWKRRLVQLAEIGPQHQVLDLACGTGDITFMVAEGLTVGHVIGVDITSGMLEIANRKREQAGIETAHFQLGDIMRLDFPDGHFDRVTVGYGLRNVPDLPGLLKEVFRLLRPEGRFLSLDFGKPKNRIYRALYFRYLAAVGSTFGWVLHGNPDVYRYIPESLKLYPAQDGVKALMDVTGFKKTGYLCYLGGAIAINYGTK
jgi:demethylmenaquinone methyltransferase / 2-methoxy-6-polyprenyl-1,4-benzoquinol methylase